MAWWREAEAWVAERLAEQGQRCTEPLEPVRIRPWSTVLTAPTTQGRAWFKANAKGTAYEASLLDALNSWDTPHVPKPLGLDIDRGWILLPDAGRSMREHPDADLSWWEHALATYAELQRGLAPQVGELRVAGVPEFAPTTLPTRLSELVAGPSWLDCGPDGPDIEQLRALEELAEAYSRWCAELEALGVPPSLQHDDLHDGNVFYDNEKTVFIDWGDAVVGHPFGTLLWTLTVICHRQGWAAVDRPELCRLRDAYIEPWTADIDRAALVRAVPLALRVVTIGRVFTWQRAFAEASKAQKREYARYVRACVEDILHPYDGPLRN